MRNTRIYSIISTPVLAFLALLFFGATNIKAAPGDLDSTFGSGGIFVTSITNAPYYDFPRSIQVQPDGKIVVCGEIREDDSDGDRSTVSFFLARYHPNGTFDNSFGTNGKIVAPINSGDELVGEEIALQPDGKIIAVGYKGGNFAVNRYNSDGTLDASFGTGGRVVTQIGNLNSVAQSVTVQRDGKIVVVGSGSLDSSTAGFAVVRYNPNGSLDTGFGEGGKIITQFSNGYAYALAAMLQPDGKIVVAGNGGNGSYDRHFALVRYNADGSLDFGFGAAGKIVQTFPNAEAFLTDAVLQPDGRIVVVGYVLSMNPPTMAIVRYNTNGSVDTSFAANGIFTSPMTDGRFYGTGIALQPDGKIVSFGQVYFAVSAALRLNPNGSPDTGFGSNGVATTNFGSSYGLAGAIQPNGRILLLGYTWIGGSDIAIARFLGDATACPNPIDCNEFFVRQHYQDFLNRQPDADGLAFWTNEIALCGADQQCIDAKRVNVSAAFFLSIEFQQTGYLVNRFYKAAYGNLPGAPVPIRLSEFLPDTQQIGQGVIVNQAGWDTVLENNKQAFSAEFVQRSRFTSVYPTSLTPDQFVDQLFMNAGVTPSATDRTAAINEFGSAMTTADVSARARAMRRVAENSAFAQQEFNRAFVLMQYFGYLRRNPNDPPELTLDFQGYNFWLDKLNQFNGDYIAAEMVKAFLLSTEYRQRFGP